MVQLLKVAGVDDKREITGVVAASMTGDLLALQLLMAVLVIGDIPRLKLFFSGMFSELIEQSHQ